MWLLLPHTFDPRLLNPCTQRANSTELLSPKTGPDSSHGEILDRRQRLREIYSSGTLESHWFQTDMKVYQWKYLGTGNPHLFYRLTRHTEGKCHHTYFLETQNLTVLFSFWNDQREDPKEHKPPSYPAPLPPWQQHELYPGPRPAFISINWNHMPVLQTSL